MSANEYKPHQLADIRYCCNCSVTDRLTQQGRCATCGSEAVILPTYARPFLEARDLDIAWCERIFSLQEQE